MHILEKIEAREYATKLEYFTQKVDPEANAAYRADGARLRELFKQDALAECGLTGHPKADQIYDFAWEERHAHGFREVYDFLRDLSQLVL